MKGLNAMLLCDFYKVNHREQYPPNTEVVYSTWTPRSNKHAPYIDRVVCVGMQGFCASCSPLRGGLSALRCARWNRFGIPR